jgi:methylmalonyl-CoA/ethylmalonyl-CoA epimerase
MAEITEKYRRYLMPVKKSTRSITPNELFKEPPAYHICLVVKNRDKTIDVLSSVFGLGPWVIADCKFEDKDMIKGESLSFKTGLVKLEKLGLGRLCLEVVEPVKEGTIYDKFLKTKGEGLHHIAVMEPNWDEIVSGIEKKGHKKLAGANTPGGGKWAYFQIDPGGLIIEIINDKPPDWNSVASIKQS